MIDAEQANYPIAVMCRLLRVPRSSFYAWTTRVESATAARIRQLWEIITVEFATPGRRRGADASPRP